MRKRTHDALMAGERQITTVMQEALGSCHDHVMRLEAERAERDSFWLDRIRELEDSTRALSLDQLRGMHPTVAMQAMPPEPERKLFLHDPTGMITTEIDPRDRDVDS